MDNQQLREMFGGPVTCELCFPGSRGFEDQEKKWKKAHETWKRERKLQEERDSLAEKEALAKKMTPVIRQAASLANEKKLKNILKENKRIR
jgi:Skp family chaperone for outer membrane proteins